MKQKHLSSAPVLAGALTALLLQGSVVWATPTFKTVVPTSESRSQTWKFTFDKPASGWQGKNFNDAKWKSAPGGFGTKGTPRIGKLGKIWKTPDIWLRRTFNPGALTANQIAKMMVRDYHDETVEIFINGALVYSAGGYVTGYERKPLLPIARKAIRPNAANVLAVHCHQTTGGQYIDVGLDTSK